MRYQLVKFTMGDSQNRVKVGDPSDNKRKLQSKADKLNDEQLAKDLRAESLEAKPLVSYVVVTA